MKDPSVYFCVGHPNLPPTSHPLPLGSDAILLLMAAIFLKATP